MPRVIIDSEPVVDKDEFYGSVQCPAAGAVVVGSVRTYTGKRAAIVSYNNAVSSGGETSIKFYLRVNQVGVHPFNGTQVQWGTPENPTPLEIPVDVPQGALVDVYAVNSDGSNAYDVTARVIIHYKDIK